MNTLTTQDYFIHIPKTGGHTIWNNILGNHKNIQRLHIPKELRNYEYNEKTQFYISIRDPIDRFISAINYNRFLHYRGNSSYNVFDLHYLILEDNINNIIEMKDIYSNLKWINPDVYGSIAFHVKDLYCNIDKSNIHVIQTEDINRLQGNKERMNNKNYSLFCKEFTRDQITPKNIQYLKNDILANEYYYCNRLYKDGLCTIKYS